MLHDISHGTPADSGENAPATSEQLARQEAVKQIERRRRFWIRATMGTVLMVIVVFIWAMTEYHNAGGWPTDGFSQSSGIHDVWNVWIIYPLLLASGLAGPAPRVARSGCSSPSPSACSTCSSRGRSRRSRVRPSRLRPISAWRPIRKPEEGVRDVFAHGDPAP